MAFTWATDPDAVVAEPPAGLKAKGYVAQQKPTAGHFNWLFQQLGILSSSVLAVGNAQLAFDAFGNLTGATDGAESYTYTYGDYGLLTTASDGTTTVTLNRTAAGRLTGFTTT